MVKNSLLQNFDIYITIYILYILYFCSYFTEDIKQVLLKFD